MSSPNSAKSPSIPAWCLLRNRENEFNLNIPRYIDSQEPEDIQDIEGTYAADAGSPMWMLWNHIGRLPTPTRESLQRDASRIPEPGRRHVSYQAGHL